MTEVPKAYQIVRKDDVLKFSTSSFRPEKGSVLHGGIFNRELAASLAAGGVVLLLGFFLTPGAGISAVYLVPAGVLFALFFFVLRTYVFREPRLEATFDGKNGVVEIVLRKTIGTARKRGPISGLSGVRIDHVIVEPENPDGIRVVEKIALQHGTVIPGFGKKADFYSVRLGFQDGPVTIFSTAKREEAEDVLAELEGFLLSVGR